MKRYTLLALSVLVTLTFIACSPVQQSEALTNEEAKQKIDSGEVTVLDVRTKEERAAGYIQESVSIPLDELENRMDDLDKNKTYIVVCQTGSKSPQAAALMINNGFTEVSYLKSGMSGWSYPLEN
ncbi:rhodanese-like domain-containing protein [Bacillus sp. SCS-153A]|uniref:rhodanese-like domain-containing protein n=1 Tax=Rossellomorea sedimentorum TaxID=3115294 RepID=UPI0039063BAF